MKYIIAHDLGTSGNKATLYDEQGTLVKSTVSSYPTVFFNGNWAEQDPRDWWKAVCASSQELLEGEDASAVQAVSFSGHMMGCLPVDKTGRPLRNHILYCDQRADPQEKWLKEHVDPWEFYTITGNRISASYSLLKLLWIRENEPDVYENAYKVLNAKDYIAFMLTGQFATDYTDAGGTELFDINTLRWSDRIADLTRLDLEKMPDAFESTHVVGEVTRQAARETGIPEGTPVCCGAGDGCACGVGAGSLAPGKSYTSIGSSAWVGITTEKPIYDEKMRVPVFPHAVPGLYHSCGAMQTAGASFAWATHEIFGTKYETTEEDPYERMDALMQDAGPTSHGLIFLPYLMGERSPWWNNDAKGCFLGITQETTRADMLRSVEEGVAYNLRLILDIFKEYESVIETALVGGAARSEIWTGILADVYNTPIVRLDNLEECASMGAAIIGGVGVGVFPNFESVEPFFKVTSRRDPDAHNVQLYAPRVALFRDTYAALQDLFARF